MNITSEGDQIKKYLNKNGDKLKSKTEKETKIPVDENLESQNIDNWYDQSKRVKKFKYKNSE